MSPVQGMRAPSSSGFEIATSEGGRGVKRVTLGTGQAGYRLLDLPLRQELSNLRIALFRLDLSDPQNPVEDALGVERNFTAAQLPAPNTPLVFTGLKEKTDYRVRAYATYGADIPLSDDNRSFVDFYTGNDDDLLLTDNSTEEPLVLTVYGLGYLDSNDDFEFDGRGQTPGLSVQNGAYTLFGFVYNQPLNGYPGLNNPGGVAVDKYGNRYVTDTGNHCITRIEPDGTAMVIAGTPHTSGWTDGSGSSAAFNSPEGIFASDIDPEDLNDPDDLVLWVADTGNHVIRKVLIDDAARALNISVSTKVGTGETPGFFNASGTAAKLTSPRGLFVRGRTMYIADGGNHCIRTYNLMSGLVGLLAGQPDNAGHTDNARGNLARFDTPTGLLEEDGWLYVADSVDHTVRKVAAGEGDTRHAVSTIAGSPYSNGYGDGSIPYLASLDTPVGLAIDTDHHLYVSDANNNAIRRIDLTGDDPQMTTLCGTGSGSPTSPSVQVKLNAVLSRPAGLCMDANGRLYVADSGNNLLRYIE